MNDIDYLLHSVGWSFGWLTTGYLVAKLEVTLRRNWSDQRKHEKGR